MSGQPKRSGGKREGAGRKPSSISLKVGDQWYVYDTPGHLVEVVEIIHRNKIAITVDGRRLIITK